MSTSIHRGSRFSGIDAESTCPARWKEVEVAAAQSPLTIPLPRSQDDSAGEIALVEAARAGCNAAFGELRNLYAHRLYKRILSITRNREDAEDALQDTFLRAYLALSTFEGRAKFSSWLTRIAINSALMTLRKRRMRSETSFEQHLDASEEVATFDVPDLAPDPEQACDQRQRSHAMRQAIECLGPHFRTPINIWLSHDYSVKDIAEHLGISVACAKTRLHRARKSLIRSVHRGATRQVFSSTHRDMLRTVEDRRN
jgi:RNA polymerase sigma-70 factor (ECF subfamily)